MRSVSLSLFVSALVVATAPAWAIERTDETNAKIVKLRDLGIYRAKLGCSKTGKVTSESVTNRHDPKITDQIQRVVCPGLDIRYYVAYVHTPPARILDSIEIAGATLKLPFGLKIGTSRSEIEGVLGVADLSGPNSVTYFAPEGEAGGNDGVTFILEQGRLIKFGVGFH